MTAHLDKISQKENKHIRALQCLGASRLGSHQIQRSFLGEPEGVGAGSAGPTASVAPPWSLFPVSAGWCPPVLWAAQHCPLPGPPNSRANPLGSAPVWEIRHNISRSSLLGGILLSPFNGLEVFYILRKTTFELGVLFSGSCFVFALIKFPLTQISIKCGSHQRQTLATPCLLFSERRTCLCYGNVSREWADSGKPAPATTHPFGPCVPARFQAPRGNERRSLIRDGSSVSTKNTHHHIFHQHLDGGIVKRLRMPAWSLRIGVHLPVLPPTAGISDKSLNITKPRFLHLYNGGNKYIYLQGLLTTGWGDIYKAQGMVLNT